MESSTKRRLAALCLACTAVLLPAAARGWAVGGHSYIALHTNKKAGLTDANERCNRVYGSMAVDLFNYSFEPPIPDLQQCVHGEGNAAAAEAWDVATGFADVTGAELAMAFGFSSHNDGWGTDFVAHWSSRTLDRGEGFVVTKAAQLAALLPAEVVALVGSERVPIVTHILVEYGIDLLLAEQDPGLGLAMIQASSVLPFEGMRCEAPAPSRVLVATLSPCVAATVGDDLAEAVILGADALSRQVMLAMGSALSQPTATDRRDAVAALVAQLAGDFLGPDAPPPQALQPLVAQLLDLGKAVAAPGLMDEIEATIGRVNGKMSSLGITP